MDLAFCQVLRAALRYLFLERIKNVVADRVVLKRYLGPLAQACARRYAAGEPAGNECIKRTRSGDIVITRAASETLRPPGWPKSKVC